MIGKKIEWRGRERTGRDRKGVKNGEGFSTTGAEGGKADIGTGEKEGEGEICLVLDLALDSYAPVMDQQKKKKTIRRRLLVFNSCETI